MTTKKDELKRRFSELMKLTDTELKILNANARGVAKSDPLYTLYPEDVIRKHETYLLELFRLLELGTVTFYDVMTCWEKVPLIMTRSRQLNEALERRILNDDYLALQSGKYDWSRNPAKPVQPMQPYERAQRGGIDYLFETDLNVRRRPDSSAFGKMIRTRAGVRN